VLAKRSGHCDGQTGLAHSTSPHKGKQAHLGSGKQRQDSHHVLFAANEGGGWLGQPLWGKGLRHRGGWDAGRVALLASYYKKSRALGGLETKGIREAAQGVEAWEARSATLKITDPPDTDARPLGQFLLGECRGLTASL
jgi:hypothetical protein